ncbi:helix-turn-helix transcriptional regulator [Priestia aryabhattai]|uniref:helix-turn-helix transcriptional regulator n=1 Tax=Priestia aryabhattai TaxID=412384 RepID=UPI001C8E9471|nr:helix-turn-helix transcriptional regulator [Priestia aryabhattai]MBY0213559.1 helix-turn-helix transcriptional regulator [Priestia aryabhattai]MCM3255751.1 helix-turn-helix transcriptional regulator [Priestia aryabhattai]
MLANRIPVLRAEMRWSQQELADRVGVSRQTIASLEANKYNPSLILAFEIAKQFNKTIYEVFDYEFAEGK